MECRSVNPASPLETLSHRYNSTITANGPFDLSGRIKTDRHPNLTGETVTAQTGQASANVEAVPEETEFEICGEPMIMSAGSVPTGGHR